MPGALWERVIGTLHSLMVVAISSTNRIAGNVLTRVDGETDGRALPRVRWCNETEALTLVSQCQ